MDAEQGLAVPAECPDPGTDLIGAQEAQPIAVRSEVGHQGRGIAGREQPGAGGAPGLAERHEDRIRLVGNELEAGPRRTRAVHHGSDPG